MRHYLQYITVIVVGLLCCAPALYAQDLHFSQYFNAPLLINPANTGFNPDYDYRIGGNYRNQWATVVSNPYQTMSLWGDAQLFNNTFENAWVGVGGALYKDAAGSAGLAATKSYASIAYHQMLGYSSLLTFGFSGGLVNKKIDGGKLMFDNQWNGKFFDVYQPSNEPLAAFSSNYVDLNWGINYALFLNDKLYLNVGFSTLHFNKPKESFFAAGANQEVAPRYTFFANASMKLNDLWLISPNLYYSQMAGATEYVGGLIANRNLSDDGLQQLILGLYYRGKDAVIPTVGYQLNNLKLTFNYDVTTSALSAANSSQGAYEMSIVKSGTFGGSKNVKCPTLKF